MARRGPERFVAAKKKKNSEGVDSLRTAVRRLEGGVSLDIKRAG